MCAQSSRAGPTHSLSRKMERYGRGAAIRNGSSGMARKAIAMLPVQVTVISDVKSITTGAETSFLTNDGAVWSSRKVDNGLSQVIDGIGVQSMVSGGLNMVALTEDGTVWMWGVLFEYPGGGGPYLLQDPTRIQDKIQSIAAGYMHAVLPLHGSKGVHDRK